MIQNYFASLKIYFGYKSLTSVQRSLWSLERQGYIGRDWHKNRGIRIDIAQPCTVNIPLVGVVACGQPMLAVENIQGYIQTDTAFIRGEPSRFCYLTAQGDSMNLAGIDDGDLVLIREASEVENGNLVVALIDDHATIKRFKRREGYIKLEPVSSNPKHQPIILKEDFKIQGIVVRAFKNEEFQN